MEENFDDIDGKPKAKRTRKFKFGAWLGSIAPIALIIITVVYISIFQKEAVTNFLKKYDVVGISEAGQLEKSRQYRINNLPIPFEQRAALKQGTIFLGATKEMVELALGAPSNPPSTENGREKWVYFFKENSRPTYLFFEKDKLVDAAKGNTLDNAEIQ